MKLMNNQFKPKKLKIATIVGTRPEIIRLSEVIKKLDKYFDHSLIHTGQNFDYELNEIFFDDLGLKQPKFFLNATKLSNSSSETIGNIISSSHKILAKIQPDAVLLLGDTNSCLAAISAKKLKIPIFHFEAGNRCYDQRVPEEVNRKLVDHISDINLTYSSIAREYLLREGFPQDRIIKLGSPMHEVLIANESKIHASSILSELKLVKQKYFLVSAHREENIDSGNRFMDLLRILEKVQSTFSLPIIISTHPRTRKRIKSLKYKASDKLIFMKPFSFSDYISLQKNSLITLSDSGTITEESSILGFKALNIRESHERPEGMEEATVPLVGFNENKILNGIKILLTQKYIPSIVEDYQTTNVSDKVVRIILSYIDYVNRVVWKKY